MPPQQGRLAPQARPRGRGRFERQRAGFFCLDQLPGRPPPRGGRPWRVVSRPLGGYPTLLSVDAPGRRAGAGPRHRRGSRVPHQVQPRLSPDGPAPSPPQLAVLRNRGKAPVEDFGCGTLSTRARLAPPAATASYYDSMGGFAISRRPSPGPGSYSIFPQNEYRVFGFRVGGARDQRRPR